MTIPHVPVLAGEVIELLDPRPGQLVVDCTFGAGGHARLLAQRVGASGTLIAIDRDPIAAERFTELDAAGRVMVPAFLLEHAGLEKEVVVTGSGDALEIWNRATWADYNAALASDVTDITAHLGHTA